MGIRNARREVLAGAVQVVSALRCRFIFIICRKDRYKRADLLKDILFRSDRVDTAGLCLVSSRCRVILVFLVACQSVGRVDEKLCILRHKREIAHRGHQGKAAAAGSEHRRDLRDHARCLRHLRIEFRECVQRVRTFLQTKSRGIQKSDHRSAGLHGKLIEIGDLPRMHLTYAAAQD